MKIIAKIFKWILLLCLVIVLFVSGSFVYKGEKLYEQSIQTKPIQDAIQEIEQTPSFVSYDDLGDYFTYAIVAIEDHRFFLRNGFDYIAFGRAIAVNISAGALKEGGSTIDQQLAKNMYFSSTNSVARKVAEILIAKDLQDTYSKHDILAFYANIIYYGDGYYGIGNAAQGYFDKEPKDLTLYEASLLAGLPQSPSIYQLSTGFEYATKRQKEVLNAMLLYDFITEQQYNEAMEEVIAKSE